MKVIDLLNKIANGEEVPKKIKVGNIIWSFDKKEKTYFMNNTNIQLFYAEKITKRLNDEIEVIEEGKPFNKRVEEIYNRHIDYIYGEEDEKISKDIKWYLIDEQEKEKTKIAQINVNFKIIREKMREIIDYINKEK